MGMEDRMIDHNRPGLDTILYGFTAESVPCQVCDAKRMIDKAFREMGDILRVSIVQEDYISRRVQRYEERLRKKLKCQVYYSGIDRSKK